MPLGGGLWSGLAFGAPTFSGPAMKEQLEQYVKRVKERHVDGRGNEQATKQSLTVPLFEILGYDTPLTRTWRS
jgi:hypothetical protein